MIRFKHYVEMRCEYCGCAAYYPGKSIQKAKKHWRHIGGIFREGKSFCDDNCNYFFKTMLNNKNKKGSHHRPILQETFD